MYDYTGTYDATFFAGGGFIILSGVLLLWVPVYRYMKRRQLSALRLSVLDVEQEVDTETIELKERNKLADEVVNEMEELETTLSPLLGPQKTDLKSAEVQGFNHVNANGKTGETSYSRTSVDEVKMNV